MPLVGNLQTLMMGLVGICMLVAIVNALFDKDAVGLRLICGVSIALYILRLAEGIMG